MKKILIGIAILLCVLFTATAGIYFYYVEKYEALSYFEAGTDYTKIYNKERMKRSLPVIPDNWQNVNPLHFKVQNWMNPDYDLPRHAEKTVVAGLKAQIEQESDRYELWKEDSTYYQIRIKYDFIRDSWLYTYVETIEPNIFEKHNGVNLRTTVWKTLDTLSSEQAIDSLKLYELERLNYN